MTTAHTGDGALAPELEAIATAAHDRLHAKAGQDLSAEQQAQQRVAVVASAAITAGAALGAIADAERTGELRARKTLGSDLLKHVTRTAKRKRGVDGEYEQAVTRAGRIGLSHREIATAAQVSHGTVRAILTRTTPSANGNQPHTAPAAEPGAESRAPTVSHSHR
jgi:DNA-binding NarL/FixJ family response regulator